MINFRKLLESLLETKNDSRIEVRGKTMKVLYTKMLGIVSRHIYLTVGEECSPRDSLKTYIAMTSWISGEFAEEIAPSMDRRLQLLEDLRYLVLDVLTAASGEDRKLLKTYHSVLHLIRLISTKTLSYHSVLNEWLNVNAAIGNSDVQAHAVRGNLRKVVEIYPQMREAIESYQNLKDGGEIDEWRRRYGSTVPGELKEIFYGSIMEEDMDWVEYLCYRMMHIDKESDSASRDKSKIEGFVEEEDCIGLILLESYDALIRRSSGWIKLVLLFVCSHQQEASFIEAFESVGKSLYPLDWKLCLEYLSYADKASTCFNYIVRNISLNSLDLEFLVKYSERNGLDSSIPLESYFYERLDKKEYLSLIKIISEYRFYGIELNADFMRFCVDNVSLLTDEFTKTASGSFIKTFSKVLDGKEPVREDEIIELLRSKYLVVFGEEIFKAVLDKTDLTQNILYNCLGALLNMEEAGRGRFASEYKKVVFDKLLSFVSVSTEEGG